MFLTVRKCAKHALGRMYGRCCSPLPVVLLNNTGGHSRGFGNVLFIVLSIFVVTTQRIYLQHQKLEVPQMPDGAKGKRLEASFYPLYRQRQVA